MCIIDDVLGIAQCGVESTELNSIVNVKVESKVLRLSHEKSFKNHISKSLNRCERKVKAHENTIDDVVSAAYLGDVINSHGTIDDTITQRKNKSIGIVNQVCGILESVSLGFCYMEIAIILREAMFINGILTNAEVWYNMTEKHLATLESADLSLFRKIFGANRNTAKELFYLETGKIPLRYIISKRRLMFLWTVLNREKDDLVRKVYEVQKIRQTKNDWYIMIEQEKQKYNITVTDDEISLMSKYKFKTLVQKSVENVAFQDLKERASKHSKSTGVLSCLGGQKMKRQDYLCENNFTKDDIKLLFKLRSRMVDVKSNFRSVYGDLSCRTCDTGLAEDEDHLLKCKSIQIEDQPQDIKYSDVYGSVNQQRKAVRTFKAVLRKREILLTRFD